MVSETDQFLGQIEALRERLKTNRFIDHDERALSQEFLDHRFARVRAHVQGIRTLWSSMDATLIEALSPTDVRILGSVASNIISAMGSIQRAAQQGTGRIGQEAEASIQAAYETVTGILLPEILSRLLKIDSKQEKARRGFAAEIKKLVEVGEQRLEEDAKKVDLLLDNVREELTVAAISKNANFFHGEAKAYANQAMVWGLASAAWIISLLAVIFLLSFNFEVIGTYVQGVKSYWPDVQAGSLLFQISASKVVILGVGAYVASLLSRTFLSCMNLRANNKQRAVALDTYRFLLEGASSEGERQAIIQRAAEAVFSIPETGLIRGSAQPESTAMSTVFNLPRGAG